VSEQALRRASLGARPTPLVRWRDDADVWLKCDHLLPTGSFKDRGAQVVAGLAVELDVRHVVVDSSGNAAASLAAHAARAGLRCTVFAPAGASPGKLRQIVAYGAHLRLVEGPRDAAAARARAFAEQQGALYAGHAVNPHFHDGTKSWIYEVISELSRPDLLVLPVGSGSLLLGVIRGLDELAAAGWVTALPRIVVAQTTGYASLDPVTDTLSNRTPPASEVPLAEGIAIREPSRREQMLDRLAELDATVCVLDDAAIRAAQRELALSGFYVEPTSAVAWAASRQQGAAGTTVVALTGHGLKTQG
jgi:threonine synthase